MVDKQITFDAIVAGLRKQNARSTNENKHKCMFRSPDGLKCAVGQLIEDKDYIPDFDNPQVQSDKANGFKFVVDLGHDEDLLHSLMVCHDHTPVNGWEAKFKQIAKNFDLVYNPPVG